MLRRLFVTGALLVLAIVAFCGGAPGAAGPLNLFGLLLLALAVLAWRNWHIVAGDFNAPLFDALHAHDHHSHFRAADDHYRRDGQRHYREGDR